MSERKYTDEQTIKALECCINADCLNCPQWSEEWYSGMCIAFLKSVLDLINRQKAEIAVLTTAVDNSTKEFLKLHDEYQDQKAEIEKLQEVNADLNESLRLAAEANKDMKIELDAMRGAANSLKMHYDLAVKEREANVKGFTEQIQTARAEAIKEFAGKLKETPIKLGLPLLGLLTKSEIEGYFNHTLLQVRDAIDNLVAEMTEGK